MAPLDLQPDLTPDSGSNSGAKSASAQPKIIGMTGLILGFLIWGGPIPWVFFALRDVSAIELICYRTIGSAVFCALGFTLIKGSIAQARAALSSWREIGRSLTGGLLIASNWLIFVWAISEGRAVEAAAGYYISPLILVAFGILVRREQVERPLLIAVCLAGLGVATMLYSFNSFPWVALTLAASFGYYGVFKKGSTISALPSLFAETLMMTPFAMAWLAFSGAPGLLSGTPLSVGLIIFSGVLTMLPLFLFGYGVSALSLTTVGLMQFLVPTLQFLSGVFVFGEPFDSARLLTFLLIWSGVGLYCVHLARRPSLQPPS